MIRWNGLLWYFSPLSAYSTSMLQATFTHLYMEHLAHGYFNMQLWNSPFCQWKCSLTQQCIPMNILEIVYLNFRSGTKPLYMPLPVLYLYFIGFSFRQSKKPKLSEQHVRCFRETKLHRSSLRTS